jgi:riboflavin transporter FmnP
MYTQYIQGLFQSRLGTADYALVTSSLHYHGSLDTWMVVQMTADKFKSLIYSVSGFALSNLANIFIFVILDGFCLLPAWFCYVIIDVQNLESLMHITKRYTPWKIASGAESPILQYLQF